MIKVRKAVSQNDLAECHGLQMDVFTEGEHRDVSNDHWWLATVDGVAAGFGCLKLMPDDTAYLALAGVLPQYRGQGIQKRLIKAREKFAKNSGMKRIAVTYTAWRNWPSANSLIRMGYTLYTPQKPWGLPWSLYFQKVL